ncbi:hypothetical protein K402DRAFT_231127 [Aulographum hederae CBS 113979]|uniref:Uncharacterized protein n=1 Tax=Aulographum hederae CBS 113979 TaxID=1176131 RepID=A0A6G1HC72_9PEZI|nr:hypothetical protein K402DRAFT_231127 [Aulographum hederae CBS 113979]
MSRLVSAMALVAGANAMAFGSSAATSKTGLVTLQPLASSAVEPEMDVSVSIRSASGTGVIEGEISLVDSDLPGGTGFIEDFTSFLPLQTLAARSVNDKCCFGITAMGGGPGGRVGQLADGQCRIGQHLPESMFCLDRMGGITDHMGHGCLLTHSRDGHQQWQCDEGRAPDHGWGIGCDGRLGYMSGHFVDTFYTCPTGDHDGWNLYGIPPSGQHKCVTVTLIADKCHSACAPPPPPPPPPCYTGCESHTLALPSRPTVTKCHGYECEATPSPTSKCVDMDDCSPSKPEPTPYCDDCDEPDTESDCESCDPYESTHTCDECCDECEPTPTATPECVDMEDCSPSKSEPTTTCDECCDDCEPTPTPTSECVDKDDCKPTPASTSDCIDMDDCSPSEPEPTDECDACEESDDDCECPPKPIPSCDHHCEPSPPGACPPELVRNHFEFPHLIIPIDSDHPNTAYGTSLNGTISPTISSIFTFDIPPSAAGKECSIWFLLPHHEDLETSAYSFSGSGNVEFVHMDGPITTATTFNNTPRNNFLLANRRLSEGSSTFVKSSECRAGEKFSIGMSSSDDTELNYFQDFNPAPIGLYITTC